jgi:hypothetical protein
MSFHRQIEESAIKSINELSESGLITIKVETVVGQVFNHFSESKVIPLVVAYGFKEHIKNQVRKILGKKMGIPTKPEASNQLYLFKGLQTYYPTKTEDGNDSEYTKLEFLSSSQLMEIADKLFKTGDAYKEHSRAVKAYCDDKFGKKVG